MFRVIIGAASARQHALPSMRGKSHSPPAKLHKRVSFVGNDNALSLDGRDAKKEKEQSEVSSGAVRRRRTPTTERSAQHIEADGYCCFLLLR